MNDFVELQKIYEGYPGPYDPIKPSNYYPATQDQGPYSRPIPGSPESSGYSPYRKNKVGNKITHVIDEEKPIEPAEIINLDVLKQLDELRDECVEERGKEDYSVLQLSRLRDRIISLSQ